MKLTTKKVYIMSTLLIFAGPLLSLFGGHFFIGLALWFLGILFNVVSSCYLKNADAYNMFIILLFTVFGIYGMVHNVSFWQGLYGILTAALLFVALLNRSAV